MSPDYQALDRADPLASVRDQFEIPEGLIYLDGNSLGCLPRAVPAALAHAVHTEWGRSLIRSWNDHGWINAPERLGAAIAPLIGAHPEEVLVADSVSLNVFKLLAAALAANPSRTVILSESGNFPTDAYMMQGLAALCPGVQSRLVPRTEIEAALGPDVAVLLLTHVHYKTGERWNMPALTARAHEAGALMLWDLSHSTGAVAIDLHKAGADFAVGCGYKFLNGGPGAPAFLFAAARHIPTLAVPLSGWLGHAAPFAFEESYRPAPTLKRLLCGTPPILAYTALEAALSLWKDLDLTVVEQKASHLTSLFITEVETRCAGQGLTLATPRHAAQRGAHVSFAHSNGYEIMQALIARDIVGDFRAPNLMRFGFAPLTTRYVDIPRAAQALHDIVATREYEAPRYVARAEVT